MPMLPRSVCSMAVARTFWVPWVDWVMPMAYSSVPALSARPVPQKAWATFR